MTIAIRVDNLGKRYQLGATHAGSVRELVNRGWNRLVGRKHLDARPMTLDPEAGDRVEGKSFWALRDVSFEVKQGEVVGIIGRNGSGKSTLLKILSQITAPTTGRVELHGRVASLLEVGTGFHPELSGRENVFLNGAILGMTKPEIRRKFDEIVAFAEIEKFIDTPVKRYSSGMYVRLAFAVAAHLEPEILIVDEVLAVGDVLFQKKCLGKIENVARGGRTVLFVSHNMAAVEQLTYSCVVLDLGNMVFHGKSEEAVGKYLSSVESQIVDGDVENYPRLVPDLRQEIKFIYARILNSGGMVANDEPIWIEFRIRARIDVERIRISATLYSAEGVAVGNWFSKHVAGLAAGHESVLKVEFKSHSLAPGKYYFDVATGCGDHRTVRVEYDIIRGVLHFEVRPEVGDSETLSEWHRGWGPIVFAPPVITRMR
jgi:lipopolysaccharide transport system ATP-binding protein